MAQMQKPQPAPKPAARLPIPAPKPAPKPERKPAPKPAPKPAARSHVAPSKPCVPKKQNDEVMSHSQPPTGGDIQGEVPLVLPGGATLSYDTDRSTLVDLAETAVMPVPRVKKRKSLQKQHLSASGDDLGVKTEAGHGHTDQVNSTINAEQTDQNANVVEEHLQPDFSSDGCERQSISNSNLNSETVKHEEIRTSQKTENAAQCGKPKLRKKPQVPVKPKSAQWKSVRSAKNKKPTEERRSGDGEATKSADIRESFQIDGDSKESTVPSSAGPVRVSSEDSCVAVEDMDTVVTASTTFLRRSGSYEAAVIKEGKYYDDVVCPSPQTEQREVKSVVDDMTLTHTDTTTEENLELNDTDNYYSELADSRDEDGVHASEGERDVEEGVCDDTGGLYSYADMPLVGSDMEGTEEVEAVNKDSHTKDQKKPISGIGVSFRAFFKGKLGGGKKVRKTSNSSFYTEQETSGGSMDSSVHPPTESDGSDCDPDHDYIYIDDLNESERSSEDKAVTSGPVTPPTLTAQHSNCEKTKEDTPPERPLPRIPAKRNATTIKAKPTVQVRRTQSDSIPVLPPRRKRSSSRKAMLDIKVMVRQQEWEPQQSDDDNEYIIPEYNGRTDSPPQQLSQLLEDEGYLVPQDTNSGSDVPGTGELRDSEDYILPQEVGSGDNVAQCDDGDYLVPLSQDDSADLSNSNTKNNAGDYLVPVSHEKAQSVLPCHLSVSPCHLSDSESDDDDYVRPECQGLEETHGSEHTIDDNSHGLERQYSGSQEYIRDTISPRVCSDLSTDMSSESDSYLNDGRLSLSHNDLHRVMPSLLHPTVMSLKRRSFPGVDTYGSSIRVSPGEECGGVYVPMNSTAELATTHLYADSHGSGSSFSESHSDTSDYEAVGVCDSPSKEVKQRSVTHIVQEIASSEKTFVGVLKLLNETFRTTVASANHHHGRPVLPQTILDQILKYLPMLQDFNIELLKDIEERLENWDANPRIADIFVKKGPFLKLYTSYIREFEMMCNTLDEARRKYPEFDKVVTEFEMSALCAGLALKHYMLKPIQRIPQYRLLLQEYKKNMSADAIDYKDILTALVIVNEVADHANESMQYRDNVGKLLEIQSSLISHCEVIRPGRFLLKEGILMKLSRKEMQPRRFILLNDALLYTTQVTGGYKLNNELPLSGMKVSKPLKEAFQNEFSIISTRRSFTISARTSEERDEWLDTLQKAIEENQQKRHSFNLKRSHLPAHAYIELDADFKLGSRAPVWIPDARVSMCMLCTAEFTVTFRRHHCRACGKVVCRVCSDYKAPLRYLIYKPDRVCKSCFQQLHKDMSALEDGLEQLPDQGKNKSFSKSHIKDKFHGLGSFGKDKVKLKNRPSVLNEVRANADDVDISGYLKLWRKKTKQWRPLWFVLKGKALYTYKASEDTAARKSTVVLGYEVQPLATYFQGVEANLLFQLVHRGMTPMVFQTDSQASRERWMSSLLKATVP